LPARRCRIQLATLLLAALALAAGCRQRPAPEQGASEPPGTPVRGGTVVIGWPAEPNGINPLIVPGSQVAGEVIRQLFLNLLQEQPDYQDHPPTFAPLLARAYEFSDDHLTLTFHLREDAAWSDGVPVTADDVRWTWQAQIHPDIAWEGASKKAAIRDVEVVDPHTARFHFKRAYAGQLLDVNEGGILPKHLWSALPFADWRKQADWFRQHAVFDGPFMVASWTPQQEVVLKRNPRYFVKDRPYIERLVLRVVPDQASLVTQLLAGDIDIVAQVAPGDVPRIKASPRLQLVPYWFNLYVVCGWNNREPLFSDPEVRRALTLGIDRQKIVDTLLGSYGRVASTPVPQIIWAHDRTIQPWPYDPAAARRILAAKGWKDGDGDGVLDKGGKPFAFDLETNAGNQWRNDAAVMIQDQLKKIGVRAEPRIIEFNALLDRTDKGTFQAAIMGFSVDTGLDLRTNYHSTSIQQGNYVRYHSPEVDRLIDVAANARQPLDALPALTRIQQIIHQDQPVTFLWESQRLTATSKRLHNFRPTPSATTYKLEDWWIEPKK
jgi:peptide/nickel transport system substrate-binding protein